MAHVTRFTIDIDTVSASSTSAAGEFTGYTPVCDGLINSISLTTDNTLSSTADVVITGEQTNTPILSSITVSDFSGDPLCPHYATQDTTGGDFTYMNTKIGLAQERMKVAITATSSTGQTGTMYLLVEGA